MSEETEIPDPQFHAVVLHHDGTFAPEVFASSAALAIRLQELVNKDVSVVCYQGRRLHISKPPLRYLMLPDGNVPLFAANQSIEPDDSGYLGVDPIHLEGPAQLNVPAAKPGVAPDEFFSDDDGDTINIFDAAMPDPDD